MAQMPANSVHLIRGGNVIKHGDETPFTFQFNDETGALVDLTDATVQIRMANSKIVVLEKEATVNEDNTVTFSISEEDATGHGEMRLEFIVTHGNGTTEIFPAQGFQQITITPSLEGFDTGYIATITIEEFERRFNQAEQNTEEAIQYAYQIADNIGDSVEQANQATETANESAQRADEATERANTSADRAETVTDEAEQTLTAFRTDSEQALTDFQTTSGQAITDIQNDTEEAITRLETESNELMTGIQTESSQVLSDAREATDNANTSADRAISATEFANTSATEASESAEGARVATQDAIEATTSANDASERANASADRADEASSGLEALRAEVEEATSNAILATENANSEATNLEQLKAELETAIDDANLSATEANASADRANSVLDYAQAQGDYAKEQGDYAQAQGQLIDDVLAEGSVSAVNGMTGNVTLTAEDVGAIPVSEKGIAGGVASINEDGKVIDADGNEVEGKVTSVNGQTGDVNIETFSGDYFDLTNTPEAFPPEDHTHDYNELTNIPATFTPSEHTHDYSEITNTPNIPTLTSELENDSDFVTIADVDARTFSGDYLDLANVPDTFTPSEHTHDFNDLTNIPTSFTPSEHNHDDRYYTESEMDGMMANKSDIGHSHSYGEITGKPETFPPESHTHSFTELEDVPATFTPSAHNHDDRYYTEAEVDDLLTGKTDAGHTHDYSEITNAPTVPTTPEDIGAEPAFTKNSAFNKDFGNTSDTVARGNHQHYYEDLLNKPTIPTATSQLTNDSNFATINQIPDTSGLATKNELNAKQDALGYTPVNKAGDSMTGKLDLKSYSERVMEMSVGLGINYINPSDYSVIVMSVESGTTKFVDIDTNTQYKAGYATSFTLIINQLGYSAPFIWNIPGLKWKGGEIPDVTSSEVTVLNFVTYDQGTTWLGMLAGEF